MAAFFTSSLVVLFLDWPTLDCQTAFEATKFYSGGY